MYVEGQDLTGQPVTRRIPVLIGGVDTDGNAQMLLLATDGSLSTTATISDVIDVTQAESPWVVSGPGDTAAFQNAITAKTLVRNSAGVFVGVVSFVNPNASDVYLQVFNAAATGDVNLGTTTPVFALWIPASSGYETTLSRPVTMSSGIVVAPTTTATGSTAPGTGVTGTVIHAAA